MRAVDVEGVYAFLGVRRATVSAMSRNCARPGCNREAVATLSYSYADSIVWVTDLTNEDHPMVHDLCEGHADMLRVPRGWGTPR